MRYLPQQKILFQYIPRTGGHWVKDAMVKLDIDNQALKRQAMFMPHGHCLLGHYPMLKRIGIKSIFTFVRHPVAYYESVWKWLSANLTPNNNRFRRLMRLWRWHPFKSAVFYYNADFNTWVNRLLDNDPLWYTRMVESYVGPPGGEFVDFIGRTETLKDDLLRAFTVMGCGEIVVKKIHLLTDKKINNIDQTIVWQPEVKSRLVESERLVISRFYGRHINRRLYFRLSAR